MLRCIFLIALALTAGCASTPDYLATSAGYVVNRGTIQLQEIVVGVQIEGGIYKTVHVNLTAIVTTDKFPADYEGIRTIIDHAQPRIAAAIVDEATLYPVSGNVMGDLKRRIDERAQKTFQPIYAKWKHAGDYKIEIVITSLYFSDDAARQNGLSFYY